MAAQEVLRTRVYVDGYNFYYGCLKGTADKWLDLPLLFEKILSQVNLPPPNSGVPVVFNKLAVKFFTAKIIESAAGADDSVSCQAHYHNALRKSYPDEIEIIEGYYSIVPANVKVVDEDNPSKWPRDCSKTITVWKIEEKQSDVKLALNAVFDALSGEVDQVVIVTNDTDIEPAMRMIRDKTSVVVGLIIPTRNKVRQPNSSLTELAHWSRAYITDGELAACHFPRLINKGKKPTVKPLSWYERPDLVELVQAEARRVFGRRAFKWLGQPNPDLDGRVPIDLVIDDVGAESVLTLLRLIAKCNSSES
jgi:6-hydroxy-3-succinoylpyridine 3-monooxygenase